MVVAINRNGDICKISNDQFYMDIVNDWVAPNSYEGCKRRGTVHISDGRVNVVNKIGESCWISKSEYDMQTGSTVDKEYVCRSSDEGRRRVAYAQSMEYTPIIRKRKVTVINSQRVIKKVLIGEYQSYIDDEWVLVDSDEGKRRKDTSGKLHVIDINGHAIWMDKELYHSQRGKVPVLEYVISSSAEGRRRKAIREGLPIPVDSRTGKINVIDKLGTTCVMLRDDVYNQPGSVSDWDWVYIQSAEGKRRKMSRK